MNKTLNLVFEEEIGSGSSSSIYAARDMVTGKRICVKIIPKEILGTSIDEKHIHCEVEAMKKICHPNIASFIAMHEDDDNFYILEELCRGKHLLDFINEKIIASAPITENEVKQIMRQIMQALAYLHANNIAHRDLKLENVMVDDECPENLRIKLIDFGFASLNGSQALLSTFCGSLHYAPPEIIQNKPYVGSKSDIWSSAVIFSALLSGRLPFDGENIQEVANKIITADYLLPPNISLSALRLITKMFDLNPDTRITAEEALKSDFLMITPPSGSRYSLPTLRVFNDPNNANYPKIVHHTPVRRNSVDSKTRRYSFRSYKKNSKLFQPKVGKFDMNHYFKQCTTQPIENNTEKTVTFTDEAQIEYNANINHSLSNGIEQFVQNIPQEQHPAAKTYHKLPDFE